MSLGLKVPFKMPLPVTKRQVEGYLCPPVARHPGTYTERSLHTDALKVITEVTSTLQHSLVRLENLQKLTELQRNLIGVENLIAPGRVRHRASKFSSCFLLGFWLG